MKKSPVRHFCLLLAAGLLVATTAAGQPACQGPPGVQVFAKAQQLEAAGNKAAAATAYQQAYMSVDDSDGMTRALARKKALSGAATLPMAAAPGGFVSVSSSASGGSGSTAGPMPQAGRMVGSKPAGLFFVTKSVLGNFRTITYYFGPDGVAYEDPIGLSAAELAATPAKSKGRYSVAGKTLSIAWNGYPKPEAAEMNMLGGGFSWSGSSIFRPWGRSKVRLNWLAHSKAAPQPTHRPWASLRCRKRLPSMPTAPTGAAAWPRSPPSRSIARPKPAAPPPKPAAGASTAGC